MQIAKKNEEICSFIFVDSSKVLIIIITYIISGCWWDMCHINSVHFKADNKRFLYSVMDTVTVDAIPIVPPLFNMLRVLPRIC